MPSGDPVLNNQVRRISKSFLKNSKPSVLFIMFHPIVIVAMYTALSIATWKKKRCEHKQIHVMAGILQHLCSAKDNEP